MKCTIAIPIYKKISDLSVSEKISIKQVFNVLKNYKITYFGPSGFDDILEYKNLVEDLYPIVDFVDFETNFFNGINGYNSLLLSKEFYERFSDSEYILVYQPDAFVFTDHLEFWCKSNFDYIGAPWFDGFQNPVSDSMIGIGNGGFSLRNTAKSILVLNRLSKLRTLVNIISFLKISNIFFRNYDSKKYSFIHLLKNIDIVNEDFFWGIHASKLSSKFKVPSPEVALEFSFEVMPSYLFKLNKEKLPFGCHAYEKYEPMFWKKFIQF